MRVIILIAVGLTAFLFSFRSQTQDKVGKALFDQNCKSCHLPNKEVKLSSTITAPSFQHISKDYGLRWTVSFIQNNHIMHAKKDTRTLYSYYRFGKSLHVSWPQLEEKYIVKILDYVDSYPADPTQHKHRQVNETEKLKFVKEQLLSDTIKPAPAFIDTAYQVEIDTATDDGRGRRRRGTPNQ